jgi:hypothetical protein
VQKIKTALGDIENSRKEQKTTNQLEGYKFR